MSLKGNKKLQAALRTQAALVSFTILSTMV